MAFKTKHNKSFSTTYYTWQGMMQRCYNIKCKDYKFNGLKGIKVIQRWHKFENFLEDMGEKPLKTKLMRYDRTNDYMLANCYWGTEKINLVDQRFGKWFVIKEVEKQFGNLTTFECMCDCGTIKNIPSNALLHKQTTQCLKCAHKSKKFLPCRICHCKNHKDINLETSKCDLLGFCARCDKFNMKKFIYSLDLDHILH